MAEPTDAYPTEATNAAAKARTNGQGRAAIEDTLDEHGEDLATALDQVDHLEDLLTTTVIVLASADEAEVDTVTDSAANLVQAADNLTTDGAVDLAEELGESADDLTETLEAVMDLQRRGHLDDFVAIAGAFAESLSPGEVEELAGMLEDNGGDLVEALDVVLELQREGDLQGLVDLAKAFSALEVDPETVEGLNTVLGAVGDAQADHDAEETSLVGTLWDLRSGDAVAGLNYLVTLLKAQGRRLRGR